MRKESTASVKPENAATAKPENAAVAKPKKAATAKPENAAVARPKKAAAAVTDSEIAEILDILRVCGESVTTVESLTAGMISARLADIPGCSDVMKRAFVTYCDDAKHEMVKVKRKTLEKWTAVSRQCARQMAEGGAKEADAAACVSATGYAGPPSGPDDDTVGLVFLGCYYRGEIVVEEHHYSGQRNEIRAMAMNDALRLLYRMVVGRSAE